MYVCMYIYIYIKTLRSLVVGQDRAPRGGELSLGATELLNAKNANNYSSHINQC